MSSTSGSHARTGRKALSEYRLSYKSDDTKRLLNMSLYLFMAKSQIAVAIYTAKKLHEFFIPIQGVMYGLDELLTMYYGKRFTYQEAEAFIIA